MSTFWQRLSFAFRSFFRILFHGTLPDDVVEELCPARAPIAVNTAAPARPAPMDRMDRERMDRKPPAEIPPGAAEDGAIHMLALLQRDGRLIDFLFEDVAPYPDAQLGAAVRSVHQSCRGVIDHYFTLDSVIQSEEDQPVMVQAGLDPASIKLIGNVTGKPPLRGVLRHRGWIVTSAKLPSLPAEGRKVIAPAEVEV
jgi:hypothetical protein